MRNAKWMILLAGVLACGLIAAGCGGDDETSSTAAATTEDSSTTEATTDESTTEDTGGTASTPDDVYNACIDVIKGTAAEAAGQSACEQARTAFETCAQQADSISDSSGHDIAVQACQDAADQTVAALQASG